MSTEAQTDATETASADAAASGSMLTDGQQASTEQGQEAQPAAAGGEQQGQEAQADKGGEQAADKAEGGKEGDKPAGAPESYADFTLPEGAALNSEVVGEFQTLAKEDGLSQERAQKYVDLGIKMAQGNQEASQKAIQDKINETRTQWAEQARTDKEFGGDKLDENLALAKKALDAFGGQELTQLLNESGMGDHPEVIRHFVRVGRAISEDRLVPGGRQPPAGDPAKLLYKNSNMS